MPGHTAGKGIGASTEPAGHPALGEGPAGQPGLIFNLLVSQQILKNVQLSFAALQCGRHLIHRFHKGRQLVTGPLIGGFRATQAGNGTEIEFVTAHIGHFHQTLTQCVQPHQSRLCLGQLECQGPELFLTELIQLCQCLFLLLQLFRELCRHQGSIFRLVTHVIDQLVSAHSHQNRQQQENRCQ